MQSRFIGGLLLIVGTSIGGGMLALPIVNASAGFWASTLFLLGCWALMTLGALFILEVNLYLPPGKNMVSMAAETLGKPGIVVTWFSYLFLLYTLLAAYISGGADVFGSIFTHFGIHLRDWQLIVAFTVIFGWVVYSGIRRVDWLNRCLMFGKLLVYGVLVVLFMPYVHVKQLQSEHLHYTVASLMVLITSFGFAIIVPNLRQYFNDDVPALKRVILIGSLIPLICYIIWDFVIMGCAPLTDLTSLMTNPHATSGLANILAALIQQPMISSCFVFFTSICMLTAFLGVSLALSSFLSDGLKLDHAFGLALLTFVPAVGLVLIYPGAYLSALNYAGFLCVILLLLLPSLMSIVGRRRLQQRYVVPGGRWSQWVVLLGSIMLLVFIR